LNLNPYGIALGEFDGDSNTPEEDKTFLTRGVPYFFQEYNFGLEAPSYYPKSTYDPGSHRHNLDPVGDDIKHENRPQYIVVLYYYKM
jgi:hypothetical protein